MGFGTAVGSLSNTATIIYAMIGIFNKPEQEPQRQELYTRIKLLREYVGQEIDRAKLGIKQQKLPVEWRKHTKVNEDDTDEVKAENINITRWLFAKSRTSSAIFIPNSTKNSSSSKTVTISFRKICSVLSSKNFSQSPIKPRRRRCLLEDTKNIPR